MGGGHLKYILKNNKNYRKYTEMFRTTYKNNEYANFFKKKQII